MRRGEGVAHHPLPPPAPGIDFRVLLLGRDRSNRNGRRRRARSRPGGCGNGARGTEVVRGPWLGNLWCRLETLRATPKIMRAGNAATVRMAKRREESISKTRRHKRARQENTDESGHEPDEVTRSHLRSGSSSCSELTSGEVGIIESIQLKNFMCHSMLGPFPFGPNVSFVVGNNGSGKSAVLTALIVGLGGKATTTNRGSSLKAFVKDGESSADISITLRNQGTEAFKPEVYGDSIIVNQHISTEGSRSYKMKSKSGTLISSKKEELVAVLDHFNIQVDNPVCILTQEMSKQFLQTKNEGDKYKCTRTVLVLEKMKFYMDRQFFMKATQLQQMKDDYFYILKTKENTNLQIKQGAELLQALKEQYLEKKERYKSIDFVNEMQNNLEKLKHKMAWAQVSEAEKALQSIKDGISIEEGCHDICVQKLNEWQVKVSEAEKKYEVIRDKLEKISEETQALKPQCISLKEDVEAKRKAHNEAEALYNRSRSELKHLEQNDVQLRKRIEELKNSAEQISELEKLEKQRKITDLKEQLKMLGDQESTVSQQLDLIQQAIYKYKEEHARLKREEHETRQAVDAKQRQLRELRESKTNQWKRFGQHMPVLLEAVEEAYRQGRFKHKPVGPVGAFIRLKDAELALAVESCLKNLLLAFCCDNHNDERTLLTLMSGCYASGIRPQIIVNRFRDEIYEVTQRAVYHSEFPSVLTALEIDNAMVANCLIDIRKIETVLLIKNNRVARQVMQSNKPPKNCKEAFTAEGDQVFERRYYSSDNTRPKFLSKDVEAEISHVAKEIETQKARLSVFQQHLRSIDNEKRKKEDELNHHHHHQKDLQTQRRRITVDITDLENIEEYQSVDISTLEDEAQENKNKLESVKQDMEQRKAEMDKLKIILIAAERKFEEIKEKINQVDLIAGPIKDEINQADSEVENCKHYQQHYEKKQKKHLASIKKLKELLAAKEKELEGKTAQAMEICPERIEVNRNIKSLDTEMKRLRERINSERDCRGNREEIIKQFYEAKEKYKDSESKVKNLKKFITLLEEIMSHRCHMYKKFRKSLTLRCKLNFVDFLNNRDYSGELNIDHKNETLSIIVQPGKGDMAASHDTRSLSGGERSFSTVCFILSMWDVIESPFRCLDEFDVYMDMVNRRISMDMMLKVADSQHNRQFIFLTPQNMSALPTSRFIRILQLQDPERSQNLSYQNGHQEED